MINEKIISLDAEKEYDKFQYPFFFGGGGAALGPTVCRLSLVESRGYSSCRAQASPCNVFSCCGAGTLGMQTHSCVTQV